MIVAGLSGHYLFPLTLRRGCPLAETPPPVPFPGGRKKEEGEEERREGGCVRGVKRGEEEGGRQHSNYYKCTSPSPVNKPS